MIGEISLDKSIFLPNWSNFNFFIISGTLNYFLFFAFFLPSDTDVREILHCTISPFVFITVAFLVFFFISIKICWRKNGIFSSMFFHSLLNKIKIKLRWVREHWKHKIEKEKKMFERQNQGNEKSECSSCWNKENGKIKTLTKYISVICVYEMLYLLH